MILTIIALVITVIGIVMHYKIDEDNPAWGLGLLFGITGGVVSVVVVCCIIFAHIGADADIEGYRIKYEALCERQEIVESEYEDVSKSDVIKDIAEWNKDVYSYKHWAYNPWTSWFYSKRVADSLEMIERRSNNVVED